MFDDRVPFGEQLGHPRVGTSVEGLVMAVLIFAPLSSKQDSFLSATLQAIGPVPRGYKVT
jgi:hypothetical protein